MSLKINMKPLKVITLNFMMTKDRLLLFKLQVISNIYTIRNE